MHFDEFVYTNYELGEFFCIFVCIHFYVILRLRDRFSDAFCDSVAKNLFEPPPAKYPGCATANDRLKCVAESYTMLYELSDMA